MPCISLPKITIPEIALDLLLPTLDLPLPTIGVELCCSLSAPPLKIPGLPFPLGTIPGIATFLAPALSAIHQALDQLNGILDAIQVTCPLDEAQET